MTVSTQSTKVIYLGNGSSVDWSFAFPAGSADDLVVVYTDADGIETIISPSLYEVTLNAAVSPNPTAIGGSVEYPLVGSAIASGTKLTIYRSLPYQQDTSLANQSTVYQTVIEAALDNAVMETQQLNEMLGRQLTVPISDDDPTELPTATQRALKYLGFDSDGNPIAVDGSTSTNPVSSAMEPVVSAATLALSRAAYGLRELAEQDFGAGLETDGSNAARVIFTPAAESTNQAVTAAFHLTERHASGNITYTNPAISTLFDGFGYWVTALTGNVTFAINAADSFAGAPAGVALIIPPGTKTYISTDGANTWYAEPVQLFDASDVLNLQLTASVASNNLTIEVKDRNGRDPTITSPCLLPYRSATVGLGSVSELILTSALSIVVPSGGTLGTANSTAFRLWLVAYNDGGTIRLGIINCVNSLNIFPLGQLPIASSTQVADTSDSAHIFYTQGAPVTSKAYIILGYLTWESGLATAGLWTALPTSIQLFGQNVPLPGSVLQDPQSYSGAVQTGTTILPNDDSIPQVGEGNQYYALSITPRSAANVLSVDFEINLSTSAAAGNLMAAALFKDGAADALVASPCDKSTSSVLNRAEARDFRILSGSQVAQAFTLRAGCGAAGTTTVNGSAAARLYGGVLHSGMRIKEIMT